MHLFDVYNTMFSQESEASDSGDSDSGHVQDRDRDRESSDLKDDQLDQQNSLLLQQQLATANSKLLYRDGESLVRLPFAAKSMEAFSPLLIAHCRWAMKTSSEKELDQACCIENLTGLVNYELARGFMKTPDVDVRCFNMTYNTNNSPQVTPQHLRKVFEGLTLGYGATVDSQDHDADASTWGSRHELTTKLLRKAGWAPLVGVPVWMSAAKLMSFVRMQGHPNFRKPASPNEAKGSKAYTAEEHQRYKVHSYFTFIFTTRPNLLMYSIVYIYMCGSMCIYIYLYIYVVGCDEIPQGVGP